MEIVIEELDYVYHHRTPFQSHALRQVSMRFPSGIFAAILGPTGSGKSTLIQIISGLLIPSSGCVRIGDNTIDRKTKKTFSHRGKIGCVFQYPESQLFAESIEKDIAFGPTNLGYDQTQVKEKVEKAMSLVGIPSKWSKRSPFSLSGGQMRRVAIAGVLAMEPEVLILDEPTAGLDSKGQRDLLQLVAKLHQQQKITVIMVTHQMNHAAQYAQRLYLMNQGKCVAEGSPCEIFSNEALLLSLGLESPEIVKLVDQLNRNLNPPLPNDITSLERLVKELNMLRKRGDHL